MSFPRYASYRQIGATWIGRLPSHWTVQKFRHLFRESGEKIDDNVVGPMLSVSGYRGIEIKIYDDENRRRLDEELVGYRVVRPGQLVVNTMWLNYAGLGVSDYEGHVSPAYRSYWIDSHLERRFVHFLMRSSLYVQGYTRLLTGIRPNSLQMSREDLQEFPIIVPPAEEQQAIAEFLERETSKIDALIADQERLIELLKEKRQAVISQAVTKGLKQNAPMVQSKIDCIGGIPNHWRLMKLGRCAFMQEGPGLRNWQFTGDGIRVICVTNITDEGVDFSRLEKFISPSEYESTYRHFTVAEGDILLSSSGNSWGKVAIYRSPENVILNTSTIRLNELPDGPISREYLPILLKSGMVRDQLGLAMTGSCQPNFGPSHLSAIRVAVPPRTEQLQIVKYLSGRTALLDGLSESAERCRNTLEERRSALISATVTGQIDVRGFAEKSAA